MADSGEERLSDVPECPSRLFRFDAEAALVEDADEEVPPMSAFSSRTDD